MTAAGQAADKVDRSEGTDHAVRAGLVAYGLVHLMVALLAARLALGDRSGSADSTGALKTLAAQPFGAALVWAVAIGMALLVLWRVLEMVVAGRGADAEDGASRWAVRVKNGAKAVLYGALAYSAFRVALSDSTGAGGGGGGSTEKTMTAQLLGMPAGTWLVVAAGIGILGYAGALIWRGLSRKHAKHLATEGRTGSDGKAYLALGAVGYVSKGIGIAVVGGLFVHAGLTHDPGNSGGLDEALQEVLKQPYGAILLLAVAFGIGCYGVFCFARARHLSR